MMVAAEVGGGVSVKGVFTFGERQGLPSMKLVNSVGEENAGDK